MKEIKDFKKVNRVVLGGATATAFSGLLKNPRNINVGNAMHGGVGIVTTSVMSDVAFNAIENIGKAKKRWHD